MLTPRDLIIPILFISILAQIADNFKYMLSSSEIQKLSSVKLYSSMLLLCPSSVSLSSLVALSKTLSFEFHELSQLSISERFSFLLSLKDSIVLERVSPSKKSLLQYDSFTNLSYRSKYSLQFRSMLLSISLNSPNSIVLGMPISQIDLDVVLASSKFVWVSLGLDEQDFYFRLLKGHYNNRTELDLLNFSYSMPDYVECIKVLLQLEFKNYFKSSTSLTLFNDFALFNSSDNLVKLERELGFFRRPPSDLGIPL